MSLRAPVVRRGQRLTAGLWNELARAVNQGLAAPRDLDEGAEEGEIGSASLVESGREVTSERVFNPDDETQYVDVDRIVSLTTKNKNTGETVTTYFDES